MSQTIQDLIDEIVAKLKELDAALSEQRTKVRAAITALTGVPFVEPDEATVAALTKDLSSSTDDIEASVRESQSS